MNVALVYLTVSWSNKVSPLGPRRPADAGLQSSGDPARGVAAPRGCGRRRAAAAARADARRRFVGARRRGRQRERCANTPLLKCQSRGRTGQAPTGWLCALVSAAARGAAGGSWGGGAPSLRGIQEAEERSAALRAVEAAERREREVAAGGGGQGPGAAAPGCAWAAGAAADAGTPAPAARRAAAPPRFAPPTPAPAAQARGAASALLLNGTDRRGLEPQLNVRGRGAAHLLHSSASRVIETSRGDDGQLHARGAGRRDVLGAAGRVREAPGATGRPGQRRRRACAARRAPPSIVARDTAATCSSTRARRRTREGTRWAQPAGLW